MKGRRGWIGGVIAGFVACLTATAGLPILAIGTGAIGPTADAACGQEPLTAPTDGTPSILDASALTHAELTTWWSASGRDQPSRLAAPIDDVIRLYFDEGDAEGVRADIALAQAIHETGHFTSTDTSRNNFARINHDDGTSVGQAFPDVATGIRAHIQLLKKYADGNDVQLANPDVAPDAGYTVRSWGELAGTWASSPDYWTRISAVYDEMLTYAGQSGTADPPPDPGGCPTAPPHGAAVPAEELTEVRGIVVHSSIAAELDAMLASAEAGGLHLAGWGYRSHERQIELRRAHCGISHYAIYEMPSFRCSPPTARPGASMHEQGLAVDFANCSSRSTRCWQWLDANAATYGLFNLPSEPWHWSVDGS